MLAADIKRFLERPSADPAKIVPAAPAPPGAPIGDPGQDWLARPGWCSWDDADPGRVAVLPATAIASGRPVRGATGTVLVPVGQILRALRGAYSRPIAGPISSSRTVSSATHATLMIAPGSNMSNMR